MDKWKAVQVGVISGMFTVTGVEVGKNPGDNPHVENETKGADQPIGWEFFTVATTSTMISSVSSAPPGWRVDYGGNSFIRRI